MLTPEYLDTLPDTLVSLWQRVEDDILRDIARRIGKMDTVTETAAWQLWRLEQTRALRTDIVRLLAKYSGKSDTEIRRLLQEAGTRTLASDDALYQAMGLDPPNVHLTRTAQLAERRISADAGDVAKLYPHDSEYGHTTV